MVKYDIGIAVQYFLNGDLQEDLIRKQVRELAATGYRCIYAHARQGMTTPYFSEAWWRVIDVIVECCQECGIKFAIWDEDCYPSPCAGSRIIQNHPEYISYSLDFVVADVTGGKRCCLELKDKALLGCFAVCGSEIRDITSYCGTIRSPWERRWVNISGYSPIMKIAAPHWRAVNYHKTWALECIPECDCKIVAVHIKSGIDDGHNTDVMSYGAISEFLRLTHQTYLDRYGQETFDKVFVSSFMDEPAPFGKFPWNNDFANEFKKIHGFDLVPLLPHLVLDIDDNSRNIRLKYRDVQRILTCENYLGQIQKWCANHHIASAGHLTRTEWLSFSNYCWPNELRCCKYLDVPCCDPLGAEVALPDAASYHTGIKVVQSAAYWFDRPRAGSDALAVCGNESSLRDLKFMVDYHLVLGVNHFTLHGASYSWAGPRKDEVPPSLYYQHTEWEKMRLLWDELDQRCTRLAAGKLQVNCALYYPAAQLVTGENGALDENLEIQVHKFVEKLLQGHKEFVFLDAVTMGEISPQELVARCPYFIIPPEVHFFEPELKGLLESYKSAGGKVVECENWDTIPGVELCGKRAEHVFVLRRKLDNGSFEIFLFNRSEEEFIGTIDGVPVYVPPRSGDFLKSPKILESVVATPENWSVEFDANHVPLSYYKTPSKAVDLMNREEFLSIDNSYRCEFLLSGLPKELYLIADPEAAGANIPWKAFLNDQEIANWRVERWYDEGNLVADIGKMVASDSVPRLNILRIECAAPLAECFYLRGDFEVKFRHGQKALPELKAAVRKYDLTSLVDWSTLGHGTYSGKGIYRTIISLQAGNYILDCGIVEDICELKVDGKNVMTRISPPYQIEFAVANSGSHQLELAVFNAPGNRDRLSMRPAGLLGPVFIKKTE